MRLYLLIPLLVLGLAALIAAVVLVVRHATERRLRETQARTLERHLDEVQSLYDTMRGWRHDFHNHIQTLKAYRAMGETAQLDAYLDALDGDLRGLDRLLKTGNVMLDATLNAKLTLAGSLGIDIRADARVPERLPLSDVDLCVLIGNLLDNAMEACARQPEGEPRFLRVYIERKRDTLYISVQNSTHGRARRIDGRFVSAKGGGLRRGHGLDSIDRVVRRCQGYCKRANEDGAFTTEILLPLRG